MDKEEIKLLDIQLIATVFYIVSLLISIFLTYNDKYKIINKKGMMNDKNSNNLSIFNRALVLILTIVFLYISFKNQKIAQKKGNDLNPFKLQIAASELSVISALIVLYVVITSGEYSIIAGAENPNL